ncbi:MAG: Bro-N domain-containing protein [archaeon]
MDSKDALVVFQGKHIRRIWHKDEWYFSVVDTVAVLTDSPDSRNYWKVLKHRENQLVTICNPLKLEAPDGKLRNTDCASTESMFRIIQSIPSKKAEPFKRWLAKVGYERVQEIEDPELAQVRMKHLYEQKGYSKNWIDKRLRGIAIRQELTEEWKNRGMNNNIEYAILTNEITKATFDKTVEEYKQYKNLKKENLRDHMTDLELIFSMLGEASTTEIAKNKDAQGFIENKIAAKKGGKIAGDARKNLELESGSKVATSENYLDEPEITKKLKYRKYTQ